MPLFVGESNPYGADPAHALYPLPAGASGDRLCRLVMGLRRTDYLQRFRRVNLCAGPWSMPEARAKASELAAEWEGETLVLLGQKVAAAFGARPFKPFTVYHPSPCWPRCVVLPHPSGLCRIWNEPGAFDRARALLRAEGVL